MLRSPWDTRARLQRRKWMSKIQEQIWISAFTQAMQNARASDITSASYGSQPTLEEQTELAAEHADVVAELAMPLIPTLPGNED